MTYDPKTDWQYEVANGDTVLGWVEWEQHKKDAEVSETIINQALEWVDPGLYTGYKPFDQREKIPNWFTKDWRSLPNNQLDERIEAIEEWEKAHGHDPRLKCYPEFECRAIEGYAHHLVDGLLKEIKSLTETDEGVPLWRPETGFARQPVSETELIPNAACEVTNPHQPHCWGPMNQSNEYWCQGIALPTNKKGTS